MKYYKTIIYTVFLTLTYCYGEEKKTSVYHNPVDGKNYEADWKAYKPQTPQTKTPKYPLVVNSGIRLLTQQSVFHENTTVKELTDYILKIHGNLGDVRKEHEQTGQILLEVELSKSKKPTFSLLHQGDLDQDFLQKFHDKLKGMKEYQSKKETIKFQIEFEIKKK